MSVQPKDFSVNQRDCLYFNQHVFGQGFDGNAAARGFARKILGIHFVESRKVAHIGEEAGGFDYFFEICACRFEYGLYIAAGLLRLRFDIRGVYVARGGIDGYLSRRVNQTVCAHRLRIGTYCSRRVFGAT